MTLVVRTPIRRLGPLLAVGCLLSVAMAGCVTPRLSKPEAADQVLVRGEELVDDLADEDIGEARFVEIVDLECDGDDDEALYRMVARYAIDVEPRQAEAVLTDIQELWTDDLGYEALDDGVFWGDSGYAVIRVQSGATQYAATLLPDQTAITISISSECFEDPDPDAWFDPISPPGSAPSE